MKNRYSLLTKHSNLGTWNRKHTKMKQSALSDSLCKKWYWTTTYVCGSLFNDFTLEQQWFCRIWSKSATSPLSVTIGLSQDLSSRFNCSPFCRNPCMTRQGRASNMHNSCQFLSSWMYKDTPEPEPKIDQTKSIYSMSITCQNTHFPCC